MREAIPEAASQGFFELLDGVLSSGEPFVGKRAPLTLGSGEDARTVFVDFVYQPIFEANGQVSGVFVEGNDVTDHVKAQEHLTLINFELKHRVKNTLAMVSAIASQTLKPGGPDTRIASFRQRLEAFGRAHDILTTETWSTAQLLDVVAAALEPHHDGRIAWRGPDLTLGSKQALSLSLALHELATNATKYGALSARGGRVDIFWDVVPGERAQLPRVRMARNGRPGHRPADAQGVRVSPHPAGAGGRFRSGAGNVLRPGGGRVPPVGADREPSGGRGGFLLNGLDLGRQLSWRGVPHSDRE